MPDVEAACSALCKRGVQSLAGPIERRWNMRTANFVDPAGRAWEIGQRIGPKWAGVPWRPSRRDDEVQVAQTERLLLRWLTPGDAEFVRELVNEPSWIEYIGDKGVRTREDAARYLENGPLAMYRNLGYGLYCVESKELGRPIGICGLIKRETLDDVDIGFAFLPRYWGQGYAFESASEVLSYGRRALGLSRIVAILSQHNERSRKLVGALGFAFERMVSMPPGDEELLLYAAP